MSNYEKSPLVNITKSGTYKLKLIRPKAEKMEERFKKNKSGFASCRLFFLAEDGHCMTKNYSAEFGKGLAMLIGKLTGGYVEAPAQDCTIQQLIDFCEPAFGKKGVFEIEANQNGEWNGRPQYNYAVKKIAPLVDVKTESAPSDEEEGIPF